MNNRTSNLSMDMEYGGEDDDDDDAEDVAMMREMPPMSSYLSRVQFWSKFAVVPAVFIAFNYIAFTTLISLDRRAYWSNELDGGGILRTFQANTFYTALILLVNTALLYRSAIYLERDLEAWRRHLLSLEQTSSNNSEGSTNSAAQSHKHVFAQVSLKVDKFLGHRPPQGQARTVPVSVSFLYFLAAACCIGGLVSAALRGYGSTAHFAEYCSPSKRSEHKKQKQQEDIAGLPDAVQDWAKASIYSQRFDDGQQNRANFVHLKDGRTFFTVQTPTAIREADDDIYPSYVHSLAVVDPKDSSVPKVYSDVASPTDFQSLGGEIDTDSEAFCCIYSVKQQQQPTHGRMKHRILCAVSAEEGIHNVSMAGEEQNQRNRWHFQRSAATGRNGDYYYYIRWYHNECSIAGCHGGEVLEFFKLAPSSMKIDSMANVTIGGEGRRAFDDFGKSNGSVCARYQAWIAGIVAVLVAIPVSFCLIKIKNLPAGIVPGVLSASFVLFAINDKVAKGIVALLVLTTSCFLLSKPPNWAKRETIIWCHYSLALFALATGDFDEPYFVLVLFFAVGIMLNHPVLQIGGWIIPPVMILYNLVLIFIEGFTEAWVLIPISIVVGCGMVSAGETLRKYRAYIKFYARRVWTAAKAALQERASTTTATPDTADREDLTRRLID